jgi:hypothetical protein
MPNKGDAAAGKSRFGNRMPGDVQLGHARRFVRPRRPMQD